MIKIKSLLMFIMVTLAFEPVWANGFLLDSSTRNLVITRALNELSAELPDSFKAVLNSKINVVFNKLNDTEIVDIDDSCNGPLVLGRNLELNYSYEIQLDNIFINELKNPEKIIKCSKATVRDFLKATIIHQLAFLYDRKSNISYDPLFLNTIGAVSKGLLIHRRVNLNQNMERSLNSSEFNNAHEAFAINFEHFIYDPEYKCRRPIYYEYYSQLFQLSPFKTIPCYANNSVVINSGMNFKDFNLDLDRLYQVHYLLAGNGTEISSRFGHAMIRLVFCAPGKTMGPQCINDKAYHVVISFRANIQDVVPQTFKGITGKYPSQLFLLTLSDILDEYNKKEFREVKSIPLNLNQLQKQRLLNRVLELFWTYKGKYYFFTNNCANEALNILRIAVGNYENLQQKNILTPIGLLKYLVDVKLADEKVFSDLKSAEVGGYYFPSMNEKLMDSLNVFGVHLTRFRDYVLNYGAEERLSIYQKAIETSDDKIKTAANALRIENSILQFQNIKVNNDLASVFLIDPSKKNDLEKLITEKVNILRTLNSKITSRKILKSGYGIPMRDDFELINTDVSINTTQEINAKIKMVSDELLALSDQYLKEDMDDIADTNKVRVELLKILSPITTLDKTNL